MDKITSFNLTFRDRPCRVEHELDDVFVLIQFMDGHTAVAARQEVVAISMIPKEADPDRLTQHQIQQIKLAALRQQEETPAEDIRNALQVLEASGCKSVAPDMGEVITFTRDDFYAVLARLYSAVQKLEAK